MNRIQIYLDDESIRLLERAASETGLTRSELIRHAIRQKYPTGDGEVRWARIEPAIGILSDWTESGAQYVQRTRRNRRRNLADTA